MEANRARKPNYRKDDNNKKNIQNLIAIMITAICAVMLINMLLSRMQESRREEVPYNQFLTMVDEGEVLKAEIKYDTIEFKTEDSPGAITYWTGKVDYEGLPERLEAAGVEFKTESTDTGDMILSLFMSYVFPILLTFGMLMWIMRSRGGGMM